MAYTRRKETRFIAQDRLEDPVFRCLFFTGRAVGISSRAMKESSSEGIIADEGIIKVVLGLNKAVLIDVL